MIEVVGKDGMIYHLKVACPASDIDHSDARDLSDVEQRLLKVFKDGTKREPRIVRVR